MTDFQDTLPPKNSNRNELKDAILRQWVMLQLIPREPGGVTAQQLQAKLAGIDPLYEVHKRTVERNLMALMSVFPALDYRAGPNGNLWFWQKDAVLDIPKLDAKTALMFRLAEAFLAPVLPRSTLSELRPHFRRAQEILDAAGDDQHSIWPAKVQVIPNSQPLLHPDVRPDILEVVYAALFEDRRFQARYRPRNGPARDYEVSPRGLVIRDGIIYVVATLFEYTDLKHLVLHRMETASLLDSPVSPMRSFKLERYAKTCFDYPLDVLSVTTSGTVTPPAKLKVQLLFDAEIAVHLEESPLSEDQRSERLPDGRVRFRATVANTQRLRWWLLGFGDRVEVLEPPALRDEIALTLSNAVQRYQA
ncbi:WYL domain-containing protein [Methylococcus sp. ANG]|uniref:helix-turn-helix transcriptional regulator n=1 Tax=unclassified Methylococcus TaxID=2618889 RepID=UPI001C533A39|nr:WYL domain-containing protein [Methylococcus sp. Mc7]QXP84747.1 WYL domain-containing protein [Methylococcus sp. Mc7]